MEDPVSLKEEIMMLDLDFEMVFTYIKQFSTDGFISKYDADIKHKALTMIGLLSERLYGLSVSDHRKNIMQSMCECLPEIKKRIVIAQTEQSTVYMKNNQTRILIFCDQFTHLLTMLKSSFDISAANLNSINGTLERILGMLESHTAK